MPKYVYNDRTTGLVGYESMTPLAFTPQGSIQVRVTLPNGNPGTWSEGPLDGSVRRGVRGSGFQLPDSEIPLGYDAGANLPTWSPSDWEQP